MQNPLAGRLLRSFWGLLRGEPCCPGHWDTSSGDTGSSGVRRQCASPHTQRWAGTGKGLISSFIQPLGSLLYLFFSHLLPALSV